MEGTGITLTLLLLAMLGLMVLWFGYGISPIALLRIPFGGSVSSFRWERSGGYENEDDESIIEAVEQPRSVLQAVTRHLSARVDLYRMPIEERGHVILAGRQGDGKTQTSITLMIADIARGAQVYWLNPHYTMHHFKDQRTDLKPIADHFTQVADYPQIVAVLKAAYELVMNVRMPLYRAGKDVGHPIVLYLDEWPAQVETVPEVVKLARQLLRESRKCNVWLVLATQDGQVETLGFKSGVRAAFNTRLIGNVDVATRKALAGDDMDVVALQWGQWWLSRSTGGSLWAWKPFASDKVAALATKLQMPSYTPLVSSVSAPADTEAQDGTSAATGQPAPGAGVSGGVSGELKSPETFQGSETRFSASESGSKISDVDFTPEETARIVARIVGGESKSNVVQGMPRYSGPKYKSYGAYYDRLKTALEND